MHRMRSLPELRSLPQVARSPNALTPRMRAPLPMRSLHPECASIVRLDANHAEFTTGKRSGISARLLRDDAACRVAPRIWPRPTTTLPHLVVRTIAAQRKGWFAIGSSNKVYAVFSPQVYAGEFGGSFRLGAWQQLHLRQHQASLRHHPARGNVLASMACRP